MFTLHRIGLRAIIEHIARACLTKGAALLLLSLLSQGFETPYTEWKLEDLALMPVARAYGLPLVSLRSVCPFASLIEGWLMPRCPQTCEHAGILRVTAHAD